MLVFIHRNPLPNKPHYVRSLSGSLNRCLVFNID